MTRLDLAIQQNPEHAESIRLFAQRDPSRGKLKYLAWEIKTLLSGQALAPEIADVVDNFHRYSASGAGIIRDIYQYKPTQLASLRDKLLKLKQAQDKRIAKREALYRVDEIDVSVIFENDTLVVRHVRNKDAAVHYGLGTKWCIAMKREGYFTDYEAANATFFFVERKQRCGDDYDKLAVMVGRGGVEAGVSFFNALDRRIDLFVALDALGPSLLYALKNVYDTSNAYPGSLLTCVYSGVATEEQLIIAAGFLYEDEKNVGINRAVLAQAICCNEATPWAVLSEILKNIRALVKPNFRRPGRHCRPGSIEQIITRFRAALVIHPNTPHDVRTKLVKFLLKKKLCIADIHVENDWRGIRVTWNERATRMRHYRRGAPTTVRQLTLALARSQRNVTRWKKKLAKRKRADAKKAKKAKKARVQKKTR